MTYSFDYPFKMDNQTDNVQLEDVKSKIKKGLDDKLLLTDHFSFVFNSLAYAYFLLLDSV